jgi:HSP20 family protein
MLENATYYSEHRGIYPGTYEPMPGKEKELFDELNKRGKKIEHPPINISELPDHYRIEIAVPGFIRDDFIIHTNDRILSIAAMKRDPRQQEDAHYKFRSFLCKCIKQEIMLPEDVDPDFVTAEYINGILHICLSKTNYPVKTRSGSIIVY